MPSMLNGFLFLAELLKIEIHHPIRQEVYHTARKSLLPAVKRRRCDNVRRTFFGPVQRLNPTTSKRVVDVCRPIASTAISVLKGRCC